MKKYMLKMVKCFVFSGGLMLLTTSNIITAHADRAEITAGQPSQNSASEQAGNTQVYPLLQPMIEIHSDEPLDLKAAPDETSETAGIITYDGTLLLLGEENGWYKVKYDGRELYMKSNRWIKKKEQIYLPENIGTRANLVIQAYQMLGNKYTFGGSSEAEGFDCSGLMQRLFKESVGMSLPRTTREQIALGTPITSDQLRPGDLIFYGNGTSTDESTVNHVGVYVGNNLMIHAEGTGIGVTAAFWDANPNYIKFVSLFKETNAS